MQDETQTQDPIEETTPEQTGLNHDNATPEGAEPDFGNINQPQLTETPGETSGFADQEITTPSESATSESDAGETSTSMPLDTTDPEVAGDAPLDEAALDASPVDAAAPEGDSAAAPDAAADEAPAADAPEEHDATAGADGDKGMGATHAGTDTPEVMTSHPCDPVTGKPLDGKDGLVATPIFGGGQGAAAASPSGHVIPGVTPETVDGSSDAYTGAGSDDADCDDDVGFEGDDGDEDSEAFADDDLDLETLDGVRGLVRSIKSDLSLLVEALDGFDDSIEG